MSWTVCVIAGFVAGFICHALSTSRRFCGCHNPRAEQEAMKLSYKGYAAPMCLSCRRPMYFEGAAP